MSGKRDPFFSPVLQQTSSSGCSTGKKCLEIGQINVRGVVKSENGFIAVVTNSLNKAYFLHENDPVFNGYVVKITGDSVVFQETLQDKLGKSLTREVVKRITYAGGLECRQRQPGKPERRKNRVQEGHAGQARGLGRSEMRKQLLSVFLPWLLLGLVASAAETPASQPASQRNELQRVNVVRGADEIRVEISARGAVTPKLTHGGLACAPGGGPARDRYGDGAEPHHGGQRRSEGRAHRHGWPDASDHARGGRSRARLPL